MSAPQPTNPDAQFPAHDASAQFSFPKEEEKVLEYWREIDAVRYAVPSLGRLRRCRSVTLIPSPLDLLAVPHQCTAVARREQAAL